MEWEVSEKETLSDHNYIIFNVEESFGQVNRHPTKTKGWQVKKLDRERLREALNEINTDDLTTSAKSCTGVLTKRNFVENVWKREEDTLEADQPAYWWNTTVAELRRECVEARRRYSRSRSRGSSQANLLWEEYKQSKKILRNSVKKAKRTCWKSLCDDVDADIWGDGYKLVMKRIKGFPPKPQLTMAAMQGIVHHLFPTHEETTFHCDRSECPALRNRRTASGMQETKVQQSPWTGMHPFRTVAANCDGKTGINTSGL
ncbi:hypothetical protein QE152_g33863 [Popillia japonica]|uniref:Endonuclease/exonuclease/phosphatase domain-containing protein n=1 Tax=Popillia japonica TaxID=7064 RepID=A0AAW1IVL0_POPJA